MLTNRFVSSIWIRQCVYSFGAISVYRYIIFFFSTKSSYNTYIETYIACVKRLKRLDISHLHSEVFDVDSTLWFIERKKMNVEILCPLFLMVFQEALTKCSAFHLGWTVLDTFFSVYILVIRIMRSDRRFLLCWIKLKLVEIHKNRWNFNFSTNFANDKYEENNHHIKWSERERKWHLKSRVYTCEYKPKASVKSKAICQTWMLNDSCMLCTKP